jgi:tRNA uridine 5-carboxymethylaminomethyl modification enzyme
MFHVKRLGNFSVAGNQIPCIFSNTMNSPNRQNRNLEARDFDVIAIGGGHAGVEAALAVSRMGQTAAIITMDAARLALMSCNPAIGGIGKSQLVAEIDALGGIMGLAADMTGIQFRRLNLSRGPAVWSTRAQCDRRHYNQFIVDTVAADPRVTVIEGLAGDIIIENGSVCGIRTEDGAEISCRAVVVATGTFLGGLIHIGDQKIKAGRIGENAAYRLSEAFARLGFELGRLKTGTPPRLDGATIDWSRCSLQPGDDPMPRFSYRSRREPFEQVPCHLTRTTPATREIVTANFGKSPIFSGQITASGPRYCPSIEDKYFRFSDKETHSIFLEPEGNGTAEIYPNGFSTALPDYVQRAAVRTIEGLEDVEITRPGYAVEYDYCPTQQVRPSLETRAVRGLFFAGQINGTSGYEEAAAQGLMAGVNAVLYVREEPLFVLDRSEAYIGVMIDDLVTRSVTEPYRMFTSRAEYRLALREDNARDRLFAKANGLGLIPHSDYDAFTQLARDTDTEIEKLRRSRIRVSDLGELKGKFKTAENISLANLLKVPGVDLADLLPILRSFNGRFSDRPDVLRRAAIEVRYEGYIAKQFREIERFRNLEQEAIPASFSYDDVSGLRIEALQKFRKFLPSSLGQAGRIEGVTPADIAVLSIHLKRHKAAS